MSALNEQIGGSHYQLPIQPVEFIHKNGIGYCEGNVIKYVARHRSKNGKADLLKARHYIDLLIELEYGSTDAALQQEAAGAEHSRTGDQAGDPGRA